jgi:hypothetical protein
MSAIISKYNVFDDIPLNIIMSGKEFKAKTGNIPLLKAFNSVMNQYGFQYSINKKADLLNTKSFNSIWGNNGFHFTNSTGIGFWTIFLNYKRVFLITIPDNAQVICFNLGKIGFNENHIHLFKTTSLIPIKELTNIEDFIDNKIIDSYMYYVFYYLDNCSFENIINYVIKGYIKLIHVPKKFQTDEFYSILLKNKIKI